MPAITAGKGANMASRLMTATACQWPGATQGPAPPIPGVGDGGVAMRSLITHSARLRFRLTNHLQED